MVKTTEQLNLRTIGALFSLDGCYPIAYGWLLGMSIWVSFFAGTIAYRTLPRQQFGALQHKIFPVYFLSSIVLASGLLGIWTYNHPHILDHWHRLAVPDVAQFYTILTVILTQGSNHFVVGPMTSRTMFKRHKLERAEGKDHHDKDASNDLKALNRQFAMLHGVSSLANLFSIIALLFHGLWIGTHGWQEK